MISHVITSVVAVLTIYVHLVGRAITAAKVVLCGNFIQITEITEKRALKYVFCVEKQK